MAQAVQNGEQGAPHLPHICVTSQVPAVPGFLCLLMTFMWG